MSAVKHGFRELTIPGSQEFIAFEIKSSRASGSKPNDYYIGDGVCYSTFSLATGSFIKISGLNTPFTWEKDEKVFIEFDVATNLGVRNARIKHEKVGTNAPTDGWTNYPYFYKIEPQDEFTNGRVTKIRDGKRQLKAYALVGYLTNDINKNGDNNNSSSSSSSQLSSPIQILKENILLINSVVSGVPCTVPFPYFQGGLIHLQSIQEDLSSSSSSSSN